VSQFDANKINSRLLTLLLASNVWLGCNLTLKRLVVTPKFFKMDLAVSVNTAPEINSCPPSACLTLTVGGTLGLCVPYVVIHSSFPHCFEIDHLSSKQYILFNYAAVFVCTWLYSEAKWGSIGGLFSRKSKKSKTAKPQNEEKHSEK